MHQTELESFITFLKVKLYEKQKPFIEQKTILQHWFMGSDPKTLLSKDPKVYNKIYPKLKYILDPEGLLRIMSSYCTKGLKILKIH